uniref:Hydroperoxide isomerase ALOXE3-like n=1 Tax=Xiphophorus maculatus TaxID=8083 RepID=A0A3B5QML9_XIPMA
MAEYKLKVTTGAMKHAGTMDHIYVILLGTEGQSPRTELNNLGIDFITRAYKVKTSSSLGKLLLVKVEKDPFLLFPEDEWYCSKIEVTTPEDEEIVFPCYRWISRGEFVELRGGKGLTFLKYNITNQHPLLLNHRKKELEYKKSSYQSVSENLNFAVWFPTFIIPEYVSEHWKEDDFFGFQFLNGTNPNVIKCCSKLPPNFPVTDEMVRPFLETGTTLEKEMEEGNIFLCDQKIMDGIPTRQKDGNHLYVAAGLCLFYKNPEGKLLPIAIQLYQQPSEQNPIFLPSDLETDWLLAKLFFRSSDLIQHQTLYHLMHTHYLAEVFTVATFRCLPTIHPLYKLLIPHFRYTLHVNILVRKLEAFHKTLLLMRRDLSQMTYSSLCLPENITERGLELIPNFYYRDDFCQGYGGISFQFKCCCCRIMDSDSATGFPSCFNTIEEVAKFITMVIFRVSAQHAAVNNGQYDYNSWVPNGSLLLCKPPPATKGQSSMQTVLETLPDVEDSFSFQISNVWYMQVLLGEFPEEHFDEPRPKEIIKALQVDLYYLREEIAARNSQLEIPYTYLNPDVVENSVTI